MAEDILFSIGIEGEAQYIAQVNRLVANVNAALARITIPPIPIPQIPNIPTGRGGGNNGGSGRNTPTPNLPAPNPAPFDAATASVGELQRELSRLQRQFSQGGDTSGITVVRDRLRELRVEMGAVAQTPSINTQPFNLATASVSELQRELTRLQRQFTQGGDTSSITGVRDRLRDLQVEMGAVNPTSFVERLRGAFSQSLSDATNWQDRVLEIAGGNIIANLFQKVGEGVINAGKFAINSAGQFESLRASLDVIAGSSGLGGKLFDQFQQLAAKSPFNFDDVGEQGTKLLAMGIPIEDVTNRLSRIGDVAAGVGREKLPSIVYAYGQIKSQGKAMAGDLSQFTNASVDMVGELAKNLGKPKEEIKKLASQSKISFADIDKALISMTDDGGRFFEMMKTQSNTFEGLWSSMEDGFQLLAANLGAKMLPLAKNIVIAITDATSSVTNLLSSGTQNETESGLSKLLSAAGGLISIVASPVFTLFGKTLGFIADNMLALSGIALGLTIAFKGQAIAVALDTVAMATLNLVNAIAYTTGLTLVSAITAVEGAYLALTTATLQSTAAAVSFWLASNPIGWIALGVAITGAAAAYLIFGGNTQKATKEAQLHQSSVSGVIDRYKDEKSTVDGLFGLLNNSPRKKQIEEIKNITTQYGGLLSNINVEKDLLKETDDTVKNKSEQQSLAAKKLLEDYGNILPSYITEKSLIGDTEQAEKNRAAARDIIHKARLSQIAEEYIAEKKLEVQKELIDLNIKRNAESAIDERISKEGFFAKVQRGLSKEWNDISVNDFREAENEKLAVLEELSKNGQKVAEEAFGQLSKVDGALGFNPDVLNKTEAAVQGFTSGSLKDLNERLKAVREELDNTSPKSAVFGKLASAAVALDDKIKSINDSLKLFGLNANSLAGLQARLGIIQDSINKADPNSKGFNDLLTKAGELDRSIKVVQDRIKQFSLVGGSAESFNFQISKLNEELNRQPSGSNLIVGLRGQIEQATQSYKLLKIELGLEPPTDSLAGLNNKLSEFNKKLNELSTSKSITEFVGLSNSIKATQKEIDAMTAVIEASKIISGQMPLLNIVTQSDLNRIKQLEDEIKSIESLPAITVTLQLQLEGDKAALQALKEQTKNAGAIIPNLPITTQGIPSSFPQLPLVETPNIEASISAMDRLQLSVTGFGEAMGFTEMQASEFGSGLVEIFEQIGAQIKSIMIDAVTNGVFKLGEGIGGLMVGVGTFSEVMTGLLFDLGDAILVQVPKVIGLGLIQSAFTPQALATFPANLALAAAGLALIGVSGIASGVLGGLQKKRDAGKTNSTPQSLNQSLGNANLSQAAGLSGQNAEKPMLTNNISITMPIYGIDGIIISKLQQERVIQQELK